MEERLRVLLSSKHRVNKFRWERSREREKKESTRGSEGETSNQSEKG